MFTQRNPDTQFPRTKNVLALFSEQQCHIEGYSHETRLPGTFVPKQYQLGDLHEVAG